MDSHPKNPAPEGAQSQWQAKLSLILTSLGVLVALLTFNYGVQIGNYIICNGTLGEVAEFIVLAFIYAPPGLAILFAFLARRPADGSLFVVARILSISFLLLLVLAIPFIMLSLTLLDGAQSCSAW